MGGGDMYSLAVVNAGQIRAQNIQVHAGAGQAVVSGRLDASNHKAGGVGGNVTVTGDKITLAAAKINASGSAGGGTIRVGGDAHGQGDLPRATQTKIDSRSTLRADAGQSGKGGKVVAWSDGKTDFHGSISARGGLLGGDGGFVETSGHTLDTTGGRVDASAPRRRR